MCEVATPGQGARHPEQELANRVLEDLNRSGLLTFRPADAHVFHLHSDYGYPIPTLDRDEALAACCPPCRKTHLSRGRFGAWKYEVLWTLRHAASAVNRSCRGAGGDLDQSGEGECRRSRPIDGTPRILSFGHHCPVLGPVPPARL